MSAEPPGRPARPPSVPAANGAAGSSGAPAGDDTQLAGAPAPVIAGARVTAKLGEGSLAEVFRAVQLPLGRAVAIKVLKSSVAPASQLGRRFGREAALLSRLAHQNIPQVYNTGDIDGRPYIVMELVEGRSLHALMQKLRTLPYDVATVIGLKIARALEYVHLRGVIHRDLKPGNVLVSLRGEVKLTDFGIAKDLAEENDGLGVVGTPAYMSPEQVLGDKLDFRSDIFSFGILLYELLTGRRPFEEEPARTVMQKIRLDRYVSPRSVRRDVPPALERILARCLEKNPAHRYPSTGMLSDDLGEILARSGIASHEARLIHYLAEVGVISRTEANKALGPAAAQWGPARTRSLRGFLVAQGAFALAVVGLVGSSEVTRFRGEESAGAPAVLGPRPAGVANVGYLRVVARPWAVIAVDGVTVDTTPTVRAVALAPGEHFVRLTNPAYVAEDRAVRIERGATVWLDVDLAPSSATARAESESGAATGRGP
jgi:serine/threonine-protein kinase